MIVPYIRSHLDSLLEPWNGFAIPPHEEVRAPDYPIIGAQERIARAQLYRLFRQWLRLARPAQLGQFVAFFSVGAREVGIKLYRSGERTQRRFVLALRAADQASCEMRLRPVWINRQR